MLFVGREKAAGGENIVNKNETDDENEMRKTWDISMDMSPHDWGRLVWFLAESRSLMMGHGQSHVDEHERMMEHYLPEICIEYYYALVEEDGSGH